ncbi:MAG: amino acid permease [Nannocystaceae bacterium]|nr:amino acid permease [Nannocystaceae bacterium]
MTRTVEPQAGDAGGLRRELGLGDTVAVVVGACVGVGIFFTPARVAAFAGDATLTMVAWALGGLVALAGALTFAEIGAMYPRTGGQYAILRDAYGPGVAFVYVVTNATAIQAGAIAVIALVCAQHIALAAMGAPLSDQAAAIAATLLVMVLAAANAAGVRWGARIQTVTVFAKVAALVAIAVMAPLGRADVPPAPLSAVAADADVGLLAALVPALFSFGGWQQATWIAGEVREPERNLPRALIAGVAIIVAVYLLTNWAYLHALGYEGAAASHSIAADAAAAVLGEPARRIIAGAVAVSAFGVLGAQLLSGPRLVFALAHDGRFFRAFGRVHAGRGTPIAAIVLLSACALALLWLAGGGGIDRLLTGVVAIDALFFAATGLASVVLWRARPRAERPLRMPAWPWVPLGFVVAELAVIAGAWVDPQVRAMVWLGVAWIVGASILYAARFRGRV